eukprot:TRINITY_DN6165_c0_g2_i1.p1 TRINITY_DN6165_c0_g2~~TRINITY_DN6165_c0_g2_i1.p1  ORF type:complete len:348 (-),score=75.54 TRINITY_DN6165_c0_g2_i1:2-1045(-)
MWRLGCHTARVLGRQSVRGALQLPVAAGRVESGQCSRFRALCAEASTAPPRPRPRPSAKRKDTVTPAKIAGVVLVGTGVAYAASEDVRVEIDNVIQWLFDTFEDFNDSSRELFERIGDRFVSRPDEPWLLDLATMKYPENIPTLVLDLDKVILHLEHDSRQGWHVVKRPFADQFFKEICHYYEVVLFSDDVFPVALDIATKWNLPVTGVLHRDFCKKKRNHFVKDLSKLGRRLDRVLIIDHDPESFQLQPENGIQIKSFEGDTSDTELADLMEFLKAAASSNQDLRQFVSKFGGGDVDVGRRYLLQKQEEDKLVEKRRSVGRVFAAKSGFPNAPAGQGFGGVSGFPR